MMQDDIEKMTADIDKALEANNRLLDGNYGQLDILTQKIESNLDKVSDEHLEHYRKVTEEVRELKKKAKEAKRN
jgi:hypothetical protein